MRKVACGTPSDECGAPLVEVNNNLLGQGKPRKLHADHEEAFNCYCQFLVKTGHIRLGGREFRRPEGGILVLTKRCRYGAAFRQGKSPMGKTSKRFVPKTSAFHNSNGVFIG